MKNYSFRKNLRYMAMAFYRPKAVIDLFLQESSFLYSVVPLIIFTVLFETGYVLDYIFEAPAFFHLLAGILGIPDAQYDLYQIFLIPIVHIADFFIFGGVIYAVSKLLRIHKVDTVKTVLFFMFISNTIGLLGFATENLAINGKIDFLLYVQPIYVIVPLVYMMDFIHKQAGASRRMSLVPSILGLSLFLGFRMIFVG